LAIFYLFDIFFVRIFKKQRKKDMARFSRMDVYQQILNIKLVPVFYVNEAEIACQIALACGEGGAKVVEFTNRGDFAIDVFREVSKRLTQLKSDVIFGVGSIIDEATAAMYLAAGANFIVAPIFQEEVACLCNSRKIAYIPGCGSVKEVHSAESWGCEIVKMFPGSAVGGPGFISAIKGPRPWTSIMPTGGVEPTKESLSQWFKAGAVCVGMGSNLITKEILSSQNYQKLKEDTVNLVALIQSITKEK